MLYMDPVQPLLVITTIYVITMVSAYIGGGYLCLIVIVIRLCKPFMALYNYTVEIFLTQLKKYLYICGNISIGVEIN